ncbi:demethylmenaquinone methyltransferase [Desulfothermobacter acidiphilus]|uniref:demethylmenaquinone methyltransferase n=1 Tax=Desulfothermobacter acidiphilus TaxID=1938353 RepID=UPI003F89CC68
MSLVEEHQRKETFIRNLFGRIAYRYDLLNTLLSFNRDKAWRRFAAKQCRLRPGGRGLDVCTGTAMLALEQARIVGFEGRVVGLDFCPEMLQVAKRNLGRSPYGRIVELVEGNAMALPFSDNVFDCATIGFALRNVPDLRQVLREMIRVVRPGGRVVSLELAKPSWPIFKQLYYLYFDRLVPLMGKLGVGIEGPYSYLPASLKTFPHQQELKRIFVDLGLEEVSCYELTGGVVAVHAGTKPET